VNVESPTVSVANSVPLNVSVAVWSIDRPPPLATRWVEMFPDSGHWWPVTKPAEVAAALETLWNPPIA